MLNRVSLVGRLTRDLDLKNSVNQKPFVAFTLAVNNTFSDQVSFISCFAWNKTAENMAKFLKKGSLIAVDGRLQTRTEPNNGQTITVMQVNADIVSFLDNRGSSSVGENTTRMTVPDNVEFDNIPFVQPETQNLNNTANNDSISFDGDDAILWD